MALQIGRQILATLVAVARLFSDHLTEDARQLGIDVLIELAHVGNFRLHHFQHQAQGRFIGERHAAGKHFEQHDAERENVGALIDRLAQTHFRRKVAGRTYELTR